MECMAKDRLFKPYKSLGETYIAMSYGIGSKSHSRIATCMSQYSWKHFTLVKDSPSKPYTHIFM